MKWPRLSILKISYQQLENFGIDFKFSILKMLLDNDKLKEINIDFSVAMYEQFRKTLRARKSRLIYTNF